MARGRSDLPSANLNALVDSLSDQYKEIAQSANDFSVAMQSALNANTEARSSTIFKNIDKTVREMESLGGNLVKYQKEIEDSSKIIEDSLGEIKKIEEELKTANDEKTKAQLSQLKAEKEQLIIEQKKRKLEKEHAIYLAEQQTEQHVKKMGYLRGINLSKRVYGGIS